MNRLWAAVLAGGLAAPAWAASPDPKTLDVPPQELARARALVQKLGSEVFRDREQAHTDLARMGRAARAALVEAVTADPNPEVRARAARLLPKAEAADLKARTDTFLADTDGKFEHDLPAWALVRREIGADAVARKLYVEALDNPANLALLAALGGSPEAGGRAVADRRMSLFLEINPGAFGQFPGGVTRSRPPSLADITLLLLGEVVVPAKDIPRTPFAHITGAQFIQQQTAMKAIARPADTPHGEAYKRVFLRWLDTRAVSDELNMVIQIVSQPNFKDIKEVGGLLRRTVTGTGVASFARAQAMLVLAQRGKDELPTIRTQLACVDALAQGMQIVRNGVNVPINSQVRDVALALCLHFEGQDMAKYGYVLTNGFGPAQVLQSYWGYGFETDDARTAAFKKWAEYEARKKAEKPAPEKK